MRIIQALLIWFLVLIMVGAAQGTSPTPGFYLCDNFTADPGRTVVDTGNHIVIAGNRLTISGGAGWLNTMVFWQPQPQRAGVALIWQITPGEVEGMAEVGIAADLDALNITYAIFLWDGDIHTVVDGVINYDKGTFAAGVDYYFAIVPQPVGALFFVKGGAYTDWTLLDYAATATGAVGNLTPYTASYDMSLSSRFFKIPEPPCPSPVLGPNLLSDPGLEANYTGGLCDTISKYGTSFVAQSADVHSGSKAQQFAATAKRQNLYFNPITPSPGVWYRCTAWGKRLSGSGGTVRCGIYQNNGQQRLSQAFVETDYTQKVVPYKPADASGIYVFAAYESDDTPLDAIVVDDVAFQALNTDSISKWLNRFILAPKTSPLR
jgi:hypothetical protein